MRAYLGAIGFCAAASAVAVLLTVTNGTNGDAQATIEGASMTLVAESAHGLSGIADDRSALPPPLATDLFAQHPYPDHP